MWNLEIGKDSVTHVNMKGRGEYADSLEGFTKKNRGSRQLPRAAVEMVAVVCLVPQGILSEADLHRAIDEAKESSQELETVLLDRYQIPKDVLGSALSEYYKCPYLPYDERTVIDADLLKALNHDYLKNSLWLPIARCDQFLDVLTNDPHDLEKGEDVR